MFAEAHGIRHQLHTLVLQASMTTASLQAPRDLHICSIVIHWNEKKKVLDTSFVACRTCLLACRAEPSNLSHCFKQHHFSNQNCGLGMCHPQGQSPQCCPPSSIDRQGSFASSQRELPLLAPAGMCNGCFHRHLTTVELFDALYSTAAGSPVHAQRCNSNALKAESHIQEAARCSKGES